jgi:hypothetical protein
MTGSHCRDAVAREKKMKLSLLSFESFKTSCDL